MFFRRWRAKRRAAIVQQWMAEHAGLPPESVPVSDIDPSTMNAWARTEAQARAAADPLTPLHVETIDSTAKVEALWEWQARFVPWLREVLHSHHNSIDFLEGQRIRTVRQFYPFEAMLDSLIRTHPRPDLLLRIWNQHVPLIIDDVSEMPDGLTDSQKEEALAWQGVVKHYTQLIEKTATHFEKHREQDED